MYKHNNDYQEQAINSCYQSSIFLNISLCKDKTEHAPIKLETVTGSWATGTYPTSAEISGYWPR